MVYIQKSREGQFKILMVTQADQIKYPTKKRPSEKYTVRDL